MGRPKDLPAALQAWASGNYGAGANPWNGTAKRVAPGGTEFTPNTKLPAQILNYMHGAGLDAIVGLFAAVGQLPAHNWLPKVTSTYAGKKAAWSAKEQAWWAFGNLTGDDLMRSDDFARTWVDKTGLLGSNLILIDVACAPSGDVVLIASGTRNVYKGTYASYGSVTFAQQVNALSANPSDGSLDYDAVAGKYIALYRVGATGMRADWDADGAGAWTAGTLPAAWTGYTGSNNPEVACANGVAIAHFFDDVVVANRHRIAKSTDGGATWTNVDVTLGLTSNPTTVSKPAYNSARNEWYCCASTTSGARKTEVLKSIDGGSTWTSVFASSTKDIALQDIVAIGDLLLGTNDDGRRAYSLDQGATWLWAGRNVMTSGRCYMRAGGDGAIVLCSADTSTFASVRFGSLGQAV